MSTSHKCEAGVFSKSIVDGTTIKSRVDLRQRGPNLLNDAAWGAWDEDASHGLKKQGDLWYGVNPTNRPLPLGIGQAVDLNQRRPAPIAASVWHKGENVQGTSYADYALYLDLDYTDGTKRFANIAPFAPGTQAWQRVEVLIHPEKPVKTVHCYLLMRGYSGQAWFRDAELREIEWPRRAVSFDGVGVVPKQSVEGFAVRDVAANSDFVAIRQGALDLEMTCTQTERNGVTFYDVTLTDLTGRDRAITLVYTQPLPAKGLQWHDDPRRSRPIANGREYIAAAPISRTRDEEALFVATGGYDIGETGRMSWYPFGAVTDGKHGWALGIDLAQPAFFRVFYNAGAQELALAYDIAFAAGKKTAKLRFVKFSFDPEQGFRGALARYYEIFPEMFVRRVQEHGIWAGYLDCSKVENWKDFGFRFGVSDGGKETLTHSYWEPMTWWQQGRLADSPKTIEAALLDNAALVLAGTKEKPADPRAVALLANGYHDENGQYVGMFADTPWCPNGIVWSLSMLPGLQGTEYGKVSPSDLDKNFKPPNNIDMMYIDSSEGYATAALDYRRGHLAVAERPLVYRHRTLQPAVFKGLMAFEFVRNVATQVHARGKLMMSNATPDCFPWLVQFMDVVGTETYWFPKNKWKPLTDEQLLYRRALARTKPYCFMLDDDLTKISPGDFERYMKRTLAYGMLPSCFSQYGGVTNYYWNRKDLYNRDRPLFKKYVPLCKALSEAGWEPITRARSSDEKVYVERFGERYLTVYNDSEETRTVTITLDAPAPATSRELVAGRSIAWQNNATTFELAPWDVMVLDRGAAP